ncbi:MAG: phytanoyl-CoA dioxygenase family protein [Rhodothermales bacterium]|nr:phytanoyl-CoA dioxygenase family protein [Rhodothermales bacterium]
MDTLTLSQSDVQSYNENGYLVVEGLLDAEFVDRFVEYEAQPKPDGWRQNLRNHASDDMWRQVSNNPQVTAIVEQLSGGRPHIVQTMYMEKPPAGNSNVGGAGVALHQDLHYLPCDPPNLIACWIALTDTDAENGGLCVVPGSHDVDKLHTTHRNRNTADHDSWEIEYLMRDRDGKEWTEKMYSFEIDGLRKEDVVRLTVPKGGGVFFGGKTIHGSFANRSIDRYRRAIATHYVPEGTWVFRDDVQKTVPAF